MDCNNGVIELESQLEKSYSPNEVILDFSMIFTAESEVEAKKLASNGVAELKELTTSSFDEGTYTYKNTSFYVRKEKSSFDQDKKSFFGNKKSDYFYSCTFTFTVDITFGELDNLNKVEDFIGGCLSKPFISTCNYSCCRSDKKELEDLLKAEIAKKCKDDADTILGAINQKVVSVCKIVYKSSGILSNSVNNIKLNRFDDDACFDLEACCDFGSIENSFEEVTASCIVDGIRSSKINISDSISCVFYVGGI